MNKSSLSLVVTVLAVAVFIGGALWIRHGQEAAPAKPKVIPRPASVPKPPVPLVNGQPATPTAAPSTAPTVTPIAAPNTPQPPLPLPDPTLTPAQKAQIAADAKRTLDATKPPAPVVEDEYSLRYKGMSAAERAEQLQIFRDLLNESRIRVGTKSVNLTVEQQRAMEMEISWLLNHANG